MATILHITTRGDWDEAARVKSYTPCSLETDGFIHCSTVAQTLETANRFYHGQEDLVVLCIDEQRVGAVIKYEGPACEGDTRASSQFPHIYGPLDVDAVTRVVELPCRADGSFDMPRDLERLSRSCLKPEDLG
jgi:uncharacterized protein (DUF952 family)